MNLIIINRSEIVKSEDDAINYIITIKGRHYEHCLNILKIKEKDTLRVAIKNGGIENAEIQKITKNEILLKITKPIHLEAPLCNFPTVDILIALPRPKTFVKMLQYAASLGIRRIICTCSERVERSYLSSPKLTSKSIEENLLLGMEQGVIARSPQVFVYASWAGCMQAFEKMCFVEEGMQLLVADPNGSYTVESSGVSECSTSSVLLAIGPEGGWVTKEVMDLQSMGFKGVHFGCQILRCEAALNYLIGQLHLLMGNATMKNHQSTPLQTSSTNQQNIYKTHADEEGVVIVLPKRYVQQKGGKLDSIND